jgi:Flp pilus assembly protein protease CpaA
MELVFAFVLSFAVIYDVRERKIPNALTVGGLCAALCLRLKLLMAVGAFLGLDGLPAAILATGLFGGLLSLLSLWRRGRLLAAVRQVKDLAAYLFTLGRAGQRRTLEDPSGESAIPYGVAIAAGSALIWVTGITLP